MIRNAFVNIGKQRSRCSWHSARTGSYYYNGTFSQLLDTSLKNETKAVLAQESQTRKQQQQQYFTTSILCPASSSTTQKLTMATTTTTTTTKSFRYEHRTTTNPTIFSTRIRLFSSSSNNDDSKSSIESSSSSGTDGTFYDNSTSFSTSDDATTTPSINESMSKILPDATIPQESEAIITAIPFEPSWYPSDKAIQILTYIHDTSGLPYGLCIIGTTLTIRCLLTPIFISAQKNSSRMAHMKPEMDLIKQRVDQYRDSAKIDPQVQIRLQKQMQALFRKYECHPLKGIMLPIVQIPLFVSMFLGLRRMPELFPSELQREGMLWFEDLTVADPYVAMPILSALTFVATIELTKSTMMNNMPDQSQGRMILNIFRGMGVLMVPMTMSFPSIIFVYWMTNNVFSFALTGLFQMPKVRKFFDIWDPPKPVPGPGSKAKGVKAYVEEFMSKRSEERSKEGEKDRIRKLNEEVEKRKTKVKRRTGVRKRLR